MAKAKQEANGWASAMRWTARILGLIVVGLFVWFAVEFGPTVLPTLSWTEPQGIPLLLFLLVALVGVLIGWKWELVGGAMAVVGAIGITALVCGGSGSDMLYCGLLFTMPLLIAGILYLGCCWQTHMVAQSA
jgi:hypothetical protein